MATAPKKSAAAQAVSATAPMEATAQAVSAAAPMEAAATPNAVIPTLPDLAEPAVEI